MMAPRDPNPAARWGRPPRLRPWWSVDLTMVSCPRVHGYATDEDAGLSICWGTSGCDPVVEIGVEIKSPPRLVWRLAAWLESARFSPVWRRTRGWRWPR